ncbi:MAG: hypothetical protein K2N20_06915, partial [Helicobacter sp.]|nr:hypothetical protein [Helicobacter sp.]
PKPLARFFNVRYACICRTPQRCVYVMPYGSNIDVARCGWEIGIGEQWQIQDSNVIASECNERGNQRVTNPNTFDCHEASASRNDTRIFF